MQLLHLRPLLFEKSLVFGNYVEGTDIILGPMTKPFLDARTDGWLGRSIRGFCRLILIPLLLLSYTFQFLFLFLSHDNVEKFSEDL